MFNKRGTEALAVILLFVVAVIILGLFSNPSPMAIKTPLMQACENAAINLNSQSAYTCYDSSANEILVAVSRGAGDKPQRIQISITGSKTTKIYELIEGKIFPDLRMYEQSEYGLPIKFPEINQDAVYVIDATDFSRIKKVEVAAVVESGILYRKCQVSSAVLPKCAVEEEFGFDISIK